MLSDKVLRLLPPRTVRTLLLAGSLGFGAAAALAAPPAGPGTVFDTVEGAATDALRFAVKRQAGAKREYGGAITRVAGGFTYAAPAAGTKHGVRVKLGKQDVAWYYTHGRRDRGEIDALNENVSQRDREMVDRLDPRRRPLFVSTPSGRILRYGDGRLAEITPIPARAAFNPAN